MVVGPEWAHFTTPDGTVVSGRIFTGTYPDLSRQYEVDGVDFTLPDGLRMPIERAHATAYREYRIDEVIEVRLRKGAILIKAEDRDGTSEEMVRWDNTSVTGTFRIHPHFFKLALKLGTRCRLSSSRERIKFSGANEYGNSFELVIALQYVAVGGRALP